MSHLFFYSILLLFVLIFICIGLIPRKKAKTKVDFFLAGRNLGPLTATVTLIATQLGAGLLLGTSQQAYHLGLYGLIFTFGISLGLIMLAGGIAKRLRALNVVTTTEIFVTHYHSPALRKLASILVTITLCGILIGNVVASHNLLKGLGFENIFLLCGFWLFIIFFTIWGGLTAVVRTDVFQVFFIAIIFIGVFLYSFATNPPTISLQAIKEMQEQFKGQLPSTRQLLKVLLMPALFALFEQDLAQIFFASRTKQIAQWAAIITTLFILTFGIIPIYFGIKASAMGIVVQAHESPLIAALQAIVGDTVTILCACGIFAAIASTADALLCAIGSNITQDFNLSFLRLNPVIESKLTVLLVGLLMLGVSFIMPSDIIKILVSSYELPVGSLLVPLLFAYFAKDVKRLAGIFSVAGGLGSFILFLFWQPPLPPEILTLLTALIGYFIGYIFSKD